MSSVITTDFERWKAQEAALGKPVALNEFVFANVPGLDPSKDISRDEKLPPAAQIVHRQAVNKAGLASENAVVYSVTLGTDAGDFVFNWIGLLNKESGTLAMITHAPEQRKIKTADGVQGNVLTRSFLLEFNGAAKETAITTSAETWQIDFTARLAGMDESQRLANRDIYGTAAFFGDGFLVTKAAEQYRVTPGTAYIEGLRGTLEEITTFNNLRDTKIYADFTFQGNLVSKWQTFVKVTSAKVLAHYKDAAGFQHYVAVIAEIDKNGVITDKRVKGTPTDRELAQLIKDLPEKYQPVGDYQPAGSYVTTANFSLELNKKIDKANISDVMGNDGDKVPSLRLLSEQIGKCQPKGEYAKLPDLDTKIDKQLVTIPGGTDIQVYFIGRESGMYSSGSNVINSPDPAAWCDYFWLNHGGKYGRLMCYISNNKVATNTLNNGTWSGWDIQPASADISSAIAYAPMIGVGQTYRVLGGMNANAVHTHTGSKPIFVSIIFNNENNQERSVEVDGVTIILVTATTNGDQPGGITFIVPPGAWYRINTKQTIKSWVVLQ